MQNGLILSTAFLSTAVNTVPVDNHRPIRAAGLTEEDKNFYGSWNWFIDQIEKENSGPDVSLTSTPQIATPTKRSFSSNNFKIQPRALPSSSFSSFRSINAKTPIKEEKNVLNDKFSWFNDRPKPTPKPIVDDFAFIQPRAGGIFQSYGLGQKELDDDDFFSQTPRDVQFLPNSDGNAIMYNTFQELGSGEDPSNQYSSFEVEKKKKNNQVDYKPNQQSFTFHTNVENNYNNNYYDPSQVYQHTRVEDNTLLPVTLTQEWPSNDNALGGAIFEVMNFIFASTGTCYIRLPVAVYWFHVFNAHIDPTESDPSSGTYALIAANQAFEGVSTLDFIVNYIGDDYRFNAEDIELSCDSTNTWTTSLLSFPGNTNGDIGRTNVRSVDGFEGKKVVIQFIYDVEGFYVDDQRLSVEPANGIGNTFTISDLSGTYLEEVWFGWLYQPGGWFSAADVLVGYFDQN